MDELGATYKETRLRGIAMQRATLKAIRQYILQFKKVLISIAIFQLALFCYFLLCAEKICAINIPQTHAGHEAYSVRIMKLLYELVTQMLFVEVLR